ncbi:MAG: hypothetical protein ABTQ34_01900 [Bdellovibrionales bacterium]
MQNTDHEEHEARMLNLMRNALIVAGHEMGETGDHWPIIKATIYQIANDYEQVKISRNVDEEMKIHLYHELGEMERHLPECADDLRPKVAAELEKLREIFDAYFAPYDESKIPINEDELPPHILRAREIISTLEEPDA